ncbi:hypothetical protein LY76DRAFT_323575 [Colletotrichum caudatum]|nr:hypothetical protein LY76DRAFT_323575 [Colletotrichum caudatum]
MLQERGGVEEGGQSVNELRGQRGTPTRVGRCLWGTLAGNKQRLDGCGHCSPGGGIVTKDSEEMKAKKVGILVGQGFPPTLAPKPLMRYAPLIRRDAEDNTSIDNPELLDAKRAVPMVCAGRTWQWKFGFLFILVLFFVLFVRTY